MRYLSGIVTLVLKSGAIDLGGWSLLSGGTGSHGGLASCFPIIFFYT